MNSQISSPLETLLSEINLKATTSGGKGGQNVNKVATRVELYFDVNNSAFLTEEEKETILRKLEGRISEAGILRITSSEDRSQLGNKEKVKAKFLELIAKALTPVKIRKKTKPGKEAAAERLKDKKYLSDKKKLRAKID